LPHAHPLALERASVAVERASLAACARSCVSTVAPSPALVARAERLPCRLAWSVHAADDDLRKLLVPTTRHSMEELRDAFISTLATKPGGAKARGLLVEVALMHLLNDRPQHAEQLAHLLAPFNRGNILVNLIPYNENGLSLPGGPPFTAATIDDIYVFQRVLWSKGILCTVRATRGDDDRAACGQLATDAADQKRARRQRERDAAAAEPDVVAALSGAGHVA
jgi:23S rRNA (adenine2503-C2)-methyltransferase